MAAPALDETLDGLAKTPGRTTAEDIRSKTGWVYREAHFPDGSSVHSFPIIIVGGHGLIAGMTAVSLETPRRSSSRPGFPRLGATAAPTFGPSR
jgi:hypothetical protein